MNLFRAQKVLLAIARRADCRLRVQRRANNAAVCEMLQAGLVEAAPADDTPGSATLLTLTDEGRRFLRIFPATYRFAKPAKPV